MRNYSSMVLSRFRQGGKEIWIHPNLKETRKCTLIESLSILEDRNDILFINLNNYTITKDLIKAALEIL